MAFEPLQTDEKLETPVKAERDMDTHMLVGCSGFVMASVGCYLLSVWPFVVFQNTFQLQNLILAAAMGFIPQWILGIFMARRFGISGACGFVGGAICTGIFLFIRISQLFISSRLNQSPSPEFPEGFAYLIPGGAFLVALFLGIVFLPKNELKSIES